MKYVRLNITTEGQSEMEFVKKYLVKHLADFGVMVYARCVLTSKDKARKYRGGLVSYEKAKNDIIRWTKEEQKNEGVFFSTMFDLYALPNDFPGFKASLTKNSPYERVEFLEKCFMEQINIRNFIPYLQLHEFEALVLANPENLAIEYDHSASEIRQLQQVLADYEDNPETINTGKETAPSKRIIKLIPAYEGSKVTVGVDCAGLNGVEFLKQKCPHFGKWITQLEQISF